MKTKFNGILTLLLALVVQISFAQEKTISGTVSDTTGGLPGVSVIIKGTVTGTETDFNGKYSIKAKAGDILSFSYLGYKTVEKTVGSSNTINVTMEEDANVLDEVVVTALGRSKAKEKLGYAVSELKADALEKGNSDGNLVNALAGKVTGVTITNSSGDVGSSSRIVIRGNSSILGNNQALFIVDGVPIDNSTLSTGRGDYGTNRAGDIDMSNVESISILKGGAATVLYGERASAGVVIITTKRGNKNGRLNIEVRNSMSFGKANKFTKLTETYSRGRFGAFSAVTHWNWGPAYSTNPTFPAGTLIDLHGTGTRVDVGGQAVPLHRNNYENFFKNSYSNTQNVSVSSGSDKGTFSATFSRSDSEGIVRNSDYLRYNAAVNGSYQVNDKFSFSGSMQYINSERNSVSGLNGGNGWGSGLIYYHHMWDLVNRNWADSQGRKTWFSGSVADPMWVVNETPLNNKINRVFGNLGASYKLNDYLNFSYKIGIDNYTDIRKRFRPVSDVNTTARQGDMLDWRATVNQINSDFIITGASKINESLDVSYMVGGNINERSYDRISVTGKEQVLPRFVNITNYVNHEVSAYQSHRRTIGVFGEVSFDYKDFLLLTATARNDWSSTLPASNRSFFYPSVNAGFIFSKLMDNNDLLSFGKIRGSWAKVGKSAPLYSLYDTFDKLSINALDQPRAEVSDSQKNPNLKPEISSEFEIGTELKFLSNKIGLDFTYYNKKTDGQIINIPLTNTTGYSSTVTNAGIVRNKGIEALLTFKNLWKIKDVNWDLGVNFTKNTNVVEELPEGINEITIASGWWSSTSIRARKGMSTGTIIGSTWDRDANGNIKVVNGTPQRAAVNGVLGDTNPDFMLTFNGNIEYKGFELGFLFEVKQGGDVINDARAGWIYSGKHADTEARWYPSAADPNVGAAGANSTIIFPGVDTATGQPNTTPLRLTNSYYTDVYRRVGEEMVEDASWLRLRTVSLGYTLPTDIVNKIGFSGVKLSVIGNNLWLKTDYSGHDPETSGFGAGSNAQGYDILSAPSTKGYSFNVKLNF